MEQGQIIEIIQLAEAIENWTCYPVCVQYDTHCGLTVYAWNLKNCKTVETFTGDGFVGFTDVMPRDNYPKSLVDKRIQGTINRMKKFMEEKANDHKTND